MIPGEAGGNEWVAVDLDCTLTHEQFSDEARIGDPSYAGVQLLERIKGSGRKVLIFTGRVREGLTESERQVVVKRVLDWAKSFSIHHLIDRVWPHPKPYVGAFVDDRGVRWRGDVDYSFLEIMKAGDWKDRCNKP